MVDVVSQASAAGQRGSVRVTDTDGNKALAEAVVVVGADGVAVSAPPAAVTEDAATAANPSGSMLMVRRRDVLVTNEVSAENDVIALNATNKGELHTRNTALEALIPSSLGAKTGANSLSIVMASDASFTTTPYATAANQWQYAAATGGISNTTTAVTIKAADGSLRNYITAIQMASEALGAATELAIRDGAGGAVLWRTKIGTAGIVNGISITFPVPLKGTAATLLEVVTLTASLTGAVFINCQGFMAA